jgi:hypothetical protein
VTGPSPPLPPLFGIGEPPAWPPVSLLPASPIAPASPPRPPVAAASGSSSSPQAAVTSATCDTIAQHPQNRSRFMIRSFLVVTRAVRGPSARQLGVHTIPGKGSIVQLQMHAKRKAQRKTSEPAHHENIAVANG